MKNKPRVNQGTILRKRGENRQKKRREGERER